MRRVIRAALLAIVVWPAAAMACPIEQPDARGDRFAARVITQPSTIPLNAPFSLIVEVCPVVGDTAAEAITLDATMPRHRHGMNYRPEVTRLDDGRWRADGFLFHMPGAWRIAVEVESHGTVDRLTLDRTVP
ncbi:MAG: hypothetical protein HQ481_08185 [Alphaproteobacteria bacterium]|nr:hypothetical protein [Alphaproteobacteria bacterium]